MSMIGRPIKIKYMAKEPNGDFERGKWYDANECTNPKIVLVVDKNGDGFGYPAKWFEIKEV